MNTERASVKNVSLEAILADGSTVHVRSLNAADRSALRNFFSRLSPESRRLRFMSSMPQLSTKLLDRLAEVDGCDSIAIIAERRGVIVGVGRANRTDERSAEVAFTVSDELQGHGVGTVLLEVLAHETRKIGYTRFVAMTKADNFSMLKVFRTTGFPTRVHRDPEDASVMLIDIELNEQDPGFVSAHHLRVQASANRSLDHLLRPRSIAVIGDDGSVASQGIAQRLIRQGFTGSVLNISALRSPLDLPENDVDLAIVAVPQIRVLPVVRECGQAGVRGVIVMSSGFSETGIAGRKQENTLLSTARSFGMRLLGPNCSGVVTTAETVSMYATTTDLMVTKGGLALVSDSNSEIVETATIGTRRGVGFSSLVSLGNQADVGTNELLEYFDSDPTTSFIGLHLSNLDDPEGFIQRARDISTRKPIFAVVADSISQAVDEAGVQRVRDPDELIALILEATATTV